MNVFLQGRMAGNVGPVGRDRAGFGSSLGFWYEPKYDGMRASAQLRQRDDGWDVLLAYRSGNETEVQFPEIKGRCDGLPFPWDRCWMAKSSRWTPPRGSDGSLGLGESVAGDGRDLWEKGRAIGT